MLIRLVDGDEFKEFRIEEGDMFLLPGEFRPLPLHSLMWSYRAELPLLVL